MSSMAEQIQARIEADGGAGAVPGSGETTPVTPEPVPAAAPSTPDSTGQGTPETIPYARFKEVNDSYQALKDYEQLAQYGYDPDSLGRLAAFEAQYMTDPTGTWLALAADLDLPQEVRDALEQVGAAPNAPTPAASDAPGSAQDPNAVGQSPLALPADVQETLRWAAEKRAEEAREAENAQTDAVLSATTSHWDKLDEADELKTPDNIKLTFISAAAARGGFTSAEQLAEAARADLMAYRDQELGSVVSGSRRPGAPLAVPGSAPGPAGPTKFGTLRDASRAAAADIAAGRLPTGQER